MKDNSAPTELGPPMNGCRTHKDIFSRLQDYRFTLSVALVSSVVWAIKVALDFDLLQQASILLSNMLLVEGGEIILLSAIVLTAGAIDYYLTKMQSARDGAIGEHKFRAEQIVDGAAEAIISIDVNHNIIAFNKSAERCFGYTRGEILGRPLAMLLPKNIAQKHKQLVRQFMGSDDRAKWMGERAELYALRKNGETFPAEISISKQNTSAGLIFTAILNDVSERKQAEKALCESEERFRALFNYSPNKLHIKDTEGRYILINHRSEELFGVTNEEAYGKTAEEIFSPELGAVFDAHDKSVIETGKPSEAEEEFLLNDGVHTYLTIKFPILGAAGDVIAVGSSGYEITERKRAEEELIHHRDNLEKMVEDRTAEVTANAVLLENALAREKDHSALQKKFVSLVSHEFRTPLTIIDGVAQRLIRRKNELTPQEVEMRANKVRSAITRMIGMIDTTLHAARLDAGRLELSLMPCDIAGLVRDVCERQAEISPSHEIQVNVDQLPKGVVVDHRRMDQVFTNLLSNAVKYTRRNPQISVRGWVEDDSLLVSVTDNGVGIPDKDLPHMFERFFRAKTAEGIEGSGIGLSVVKEFVEMHNGAITVDSIEGEGATFTVQLPIISERQ